MTPAAKARRKVRHEVLPKIELQLAANTKLGLLSRVAQIRSYAKKYFDYTWMLQRKYVHQGVTYGYFWWEANAKNIPKVD